MLTSKGAHSCAPLLLFFKDIIMFKCSKCLTLKPIDAFYKDRRKKYGIRSACRKCTIASNAQAIRNDINIFLSNRYNKQVYNSKIRNHPKPSYSKEEFIVWANNQPNIHDLFAAWKSSNYSKNLIPSIDRINSLLPYTLSNIQLVTWKDNNTNNNIEQSLGINSHNSKQIATYNSTGILISTYTSVAHAARELKVSYSKVRYAVNSPTKTINNLSIKTF